LIRPHHPEWPVPVRAISALKGTGIREVWADIDHFRAALEDTSAWSHRRAEQARAALWSEIGDSLLDRFRGSPGVARLRARVEEEVVKGSRTPTSAAQQLLASFLEENYAGPAPPLGLPETPA
jgi:LAO/AO transport system kinase